MILQETIRKGYARIYVRIAGIWQKAKFCRIGADFFAFRSPEKTFLVIDTQTGFYRSNVGFLATPRNARAIVCSAEHNADNAPELLGERQNIGAELQILQELQHIKRCKETLQTFIKLGKFHKKYND